MSQNKFASLDPKSACSKALSDLKTVAGMVADLSNHAKDGAFKQRLHTLIEEMQDLTPVLPEVPQRVLRRLIAAFGNAYQFYQLTGDVDLLQDFLLETKEAEPLFEF